MSARHLMLQSDSRGSAWGLASVVVTLAVNEIGLALNFRAGFRAGVAAIIALGMVQLIDAAAADGRSIYLLGAQQHVIDQLRKVLLQRNPSLIIAGSRNGYFTDQEHHDVVSDVKQSGADLLFIGMPSPFKEVFAADHLDEFGADLVMGVGGSFDVISGFVPRAPSMLQRTGFEWAWRLACEPRRMWKRYAVTNAWVARQLVTRMVRRRRRRPDPSS